ncbi:hypothetical protein V6N13_024940 [Hibiscus sabdariffa]|uniref:Uncharacterized protein n=2 Tax=Hibiscus sabdariffa TaxID=183260 RepID=A0ABR2QGR7_9ROSI
MTSNTYLNQFKDLDFTNEEQGSIFTPSLLWDTLTIDPIVLIIGKLFATKDVDNQTLIRAYTNIWKKDKLNSISLIRESASKRTEILNRGLWLFKDDWLALAPFDLNLNIQDYSFNTMNIWV